MFFLFESRVLPEGRHSDVSRCTGKQVPSTAPQVVGGAPQERILDQLAATLNFTQAAQCQQLCQCHGKFVPGKRGLGSSHRRGRMTHSGDQRQQLRVECKADPEVHSPELPSLGLQLCVWGQTGCLHSNCSTSFPQPGAHPQLSLLFSPPTGGFRAKAKETTCVLCNFTPLAPSMVQLHPANSRGFSEAAPPWTLLGRQREDHQGLT